jgi:uncharacterized membrane protein (DUF2068 family)
MTDETGCAAGGGRIPFLLVDLVGGDPDGGRRLGGAYPRPSGGAAVTRPKGPLGLRIIIAYKFAKTVFSAGVGAAALLLLHFGAEAVAATLAQQLLDRSTREWALKGATLIVLAGTSRHVVIAAVAGFADSAISLLEAISLRSGAWWGPWLVVGATGALLPWELAEVIHRPGWLRLLVFAINLAVVFYLLARVRRSQAGMQEREAAAARALDEAHREMAAARQSTGRPGGEPSPSGPPALVTAQAPDLP